MSVDADGVYLSHATNRMSPNVTLSIHVKTKINVSDHTKKETAVTSATTGRNVAFVKLGTDYEWHATQAQDTQHPADATVLRPKQGSSYKVATSRLKSYVLCIFP